MSPGWECVEAGPAQDHPVTAEELIREHPEHIVKSIAGKGVMKLGEFRVQESLMLAALGTHNDGILTIGSAERDINYQTVWRQHLEKQGKKAPPQQQQTRSHKKRQEGEQGSGWQREVLVEALVVNIKDAAAPDVEGIINPLLLRYHAGACHMSVFGLPAVQAVLLFKWNKFGRKWLQWEFACFLVWLFSFSLFVLLFQDESTHLSLRELVMTPEGAITVACELLALLAMSPFLLIEISSMLAYAAGWFGLWNTIDVFTYSLQIAISVLHLGRFYLESHWLSSLVAFQCVMLWFRLNYFAKVVGGSDSFSIIESMQQVLVDIRLTLLYIAMLMWGFACAYCVVFRYDQEILQFSNVGHAMLTMMTFALGGVDLPMMLGCSNATAAMLLSLLYQFAVAIVLMSLLTGVCANSMIKSTENEDLKRLLSIAVAIDELESTVPSWVEELMPDNYPAFVHVLRINPQSLDDATSSNSMAGMWNDDGQQQVIRTALQNEQAVMSLMSSVDRLQLQVQQLTQQQERQVQELQHLTELLKAAMPLDSRRRD